jgi:hypothetical protein
MTSTSSLFLCSLIICYQKANFFCYVDIRILENLYGVQKCYLSCVPMWKVGDRYSHVADVLGACMF